MFDIQFIPFIDVYINDLVFTIMDIENHIKDLVKR